MRRGLAAGAMAATTNAGAAWGHAAEQGFVLLLPTDLYIAAGGASVALTVLLLALLPAGAARALFRPVPLLRLRAVGLRPAVNLAALAAFGGLVAAGFAGPHDPLVNPLPLAVWTLWWIVLVTAQGLVGDLWRWVSPWAAPMGLLRALGWRAPLRFPRAAGRWPGVAVFLCFAAFLLADPAPADPGRLALVAGGYWAAASLGLVLFGRRWMVSAEAVTMLMRAYGRVAPFGRRGRRGAVGLWGWQLLRGGRPTAAGAVFVLLLLGTGSFDGLNETFWWFGRIGVNPLEFPGRSEVIGVTLAGLALANLLLLAAFASAVWLGGRLAGGREALWPAIRRHAPAVLPIALGYHLAHYLPSALVNLQYAALALNDPLRSGADLLGLSGHYVTTGFFNTQDTVRAIWLSQAGAVVGGHVLAILLAHGLAVEATGSGRRATLAGAPLAAFMVLYTIFGLWLLASPRGV